VASNFYIVPFEKSGGCELAVAPATVDCLEAGASSFNHHGFFASGRILRSLCIATMSPLIDLVSFVSPPNRSQT
jgi:hypothetical protein